MGFMDRFKKTETSKSEDICRYFAALFPDREEMVYPEEITDSVSVDVHIMMPNENQKFYVVYTVGMSNMPMTLPEKFAGQEDMKYAELYAFLPATWDWGESDNSSVEVDQQGDWILRYIKYLAKFPHRNKTWIGYGHTIPNGPDYAPLCAGTEMGGVLISQVGNDLEAVNTRDGSVVNLYMVIPVYREEIEFGREYGIAALNEVFGENQMTLVINMNRPNYCR